MKKWLSIFVVLLSFQTAFAGAAAVNPIKGFQEWKTDKVQFAVSQITLLRGQIVRAQADGVKKNVDSLEKQMDQLMWNLEVARDLSVSDYFALYLSQQNQSDRYVQAASKLSTREVAELMEAYARTMISEPIENVARPSSNPSANTKLPSQATQVK